MFEFEMKSGEAKIKRRVFLATSISALAGLAAWSLRKPRLVEATASHETPH